MEVNFLEYIVEQALVLIPVLMILGWMIKNTKGIPDKYIPLLLLVFGIAGAVSIIGWDTWQTIVQGIIQGILVTGAAVFSNQVYKQLKKPKEQPKQEAPKKEIGFIHVHSSAETDTEERNE